MPKRLIVYGSSVGGFDLKAAAIGQGIAPVGVVIPSETVIVASSYSRLSRATPGDAFMTAAPGSNGSGTNQYWCAAPLTGSFAAPGATFSGYVYATAVSATHYAFAGASPYLYVFLRADGSLVTVTTTGLGTVYGLAFSPDGSKLAVHHATSPYLRIYETATWTYVNAGTACAAPETAVNGDTVAWTPDGAKIITVSPNSPFLCVFDPNGTRTRAITTAGAGWDGQVVIPDPLNADGVIVGAELVSGQNTVYWYDEGTNTKTSIGTFTTGQGVRSMVADGAEGKLYFSTANETNSRFVHIADLTTKSTAGVDQPDELRLLVRGGSALAIHDTTPYRISGTVRDLTNSPVARTVRAYQRTAANGRRGGALAAETVSNAGTGDYELRLDSAGPFDVQFLIASGELLNDILYARSEPEPV